jgi:diguanylate cyclase (GGDEF)-like protein
VVILPLIDRVASTTAHRDRDDLDDALARLLLDFTEAARVTVYRLLDDLSEQRVHTSCMIQRDGARTASAPPRDLTELPRVTDHSHWRECVLLQDIVHYEDASAGGLRSLFPLLGADHVVGMVEIEAGEGLDPRQAGLVRGILQIVRNHVALLEYGERDTLTGLLNRKTFESRFGKLLNRPGQPAQDEPNWIGVIDIDRFKSINDTYGHLFGDEVLLLVSRLMRSNLRGTDQLYRFGGEEFVVVLDATHARGARLAFERVRMAIEGHEFPQVGRVTVSLGYSQVREHDSPSAAFERADAALYFAKHNGRNQGHGYETLVSAGQLRAKEERAEVELF